MRGKGLTSALLAKHLAELKQRQERKKERAQKRTPEKQRVYLRKWNRSRNIRERRQLAELLRIIRASMGEW